MQPSAATPIIIALDAPDASRALALAQRLDPAQCRLKVGKELFTAAGPAVVAQLQQLGFEIFLDLKFHDIPNTVAAACRVAADLGVWMIDVHAAGGRAMLEAAQAAVQHARQPPKLVAITVLTSLAEADLTCIGLQGPLPQAVLRLAELSAAAGLDGVVCSASEAAWLRARLPAHFALVTPGIRPAGSAPDDQVRVVTPQAALLAGASFLVIGRPVTQAADPAAALAAIVAGLPQ